MSSPLLLEQIAFIVSMSFLGYLDYKFRGAPTYLFIPLMVSTFIIGYVSIEDFLATQSYLWIEVLIGLCAYALVMGFFFIKGFSSGDIIALICMICAFPIGSLLFGVAISFGLSMKYRNPQRGVPYVTYLSIGAIASFVLTVSLHGVWLF